jgi:hypothetical protein
VPRKLLLLSTSSLPLLLLLMSAQQLALASAHCDMMFEHVA